MSDPPPASSSLHSAHLPQKTLTAYGLIFHTPTTNNSSDAKIALVMAETKAVTDVFVQ
jgi:hypothetical protein